MLWWVLLSRYESQSPPSRNTDSQTQRVQYQLIKKCPRSVQEVSKINFQDTQSHFYVFRSPTWCARRSAPQSAGPWSRWWATNGAPLEPSQCSLGRGGCPGTSAMAEMMGSCKLYLYLPKGLNFSLTSNISLRRKLKTQAESDFIHILRYSDKILVDDPGEKKCSVGDVRCFF